MKWLIARYLFNPVWTGVFPNLKRLGWWGGGENSSPPNLAISSQMMMKLGMDILWVKILSNWQNVLIMSSSFRC